MLENFEKFLRSNEKSANQEFADISDDDCDDDWDDDSDDDSVKEGSEKDFAAEFALSRSKGNEREKARRLDRALKTWGFRPAMRSNKYRLALRPREVDLRTQEARDKDLAVRPPLR